MHPATAPNCHTTGHEVDDPTTPAQPVAATAPVVVITVTGTPAAAPIASTATARAPVLGPSVLIASHRINPAWPGIH